MPRGRLTSGVVIAAFVCLPSACGGTPGDSHTQAAPSTAALACRDQWKRLGHDIAQQVALTTPSALPERWNSVAATVDYYRATATRSDCGDRIDAQKQAITALKAFGARLTAFDMQAQLASVKDAASTYASGPWPAAPSPTPAAGKHHKKQPKPARPPKPQLVAAALTTLSAQAPVATAQQKPGWQQASVVDLGDTAAETKAVTDLQFLSTQSSGWRASQQALALIRKALAAQQ